jgi:negative regulator of sigma-B (phosphoserine phosphatase)
MILSAFALSRPRQGEPVSGDAFLIRTGTCPLLVVADGLGHGEHAAEAALRMIDVARAASDADSPVDILQESSLELAGTRGAVALVARLDSHNSRMTVAGVGNIEVKALSQHPIHPISSPGILGRRIRMIRQYEYTLCPGDLIVLLSDGVSRRMELHPMRNLGVKDLAEAVIREHGQSHDDATCLAARVD